MYMHMHVQVHNGYSPLNMCTHSHYLFSTLWGMISDIGLLRWLTTATESFSNHDCWHTTHVFKFRVHAGCCCKQEWVTAKFIKPTTATKTSPQEPFPCSIHKAIPSLVNNIIISCINHRSILHSLLSQVHNIMCCMHMYNKLWHNIISQPMKGLPHWWDCTL